MAFSIKDKNLKGCLFGPPSPKDFKTVFKDTRLPDKVDLRPDCTAVEDQGELGSCTANASVGAMEYLYKRRDGQAPELSRLFVYFNSRRIMGTTNEDTGASMSDAMASVLAFGACRDVTWPYDIKKFTQEPSQAAYEEALRHEGTQYARVDGVRGSMAALAAGFPVVYGTWLPRRCYVEAATTGLIPIPTEDELTPGEGGHCMLIVGYDIPTKVFIVRNSWGEEWGLRGYCRMPFEAVTRTSPPDGFWIIGELEKPGNFSLIRPGRDTVTAHAAPRANSSRLAGTARAQAGGSRLAGTARAQAGGSRLAGTARAQAGGSRLAGTARANSSGFAARAQAGGLPVKTGAKSSSLSEKAAKMREEIRSSLDTEIDAASRRIEKLLSGRTRDTSAGGFQSTSAAGVPPSLSRLTFEVLSGDEVRHELDFADPDGDIVQIDCEWYRAGTPQFNASFPVDKEFRDVKSGTFTFTINGFGSAATTLDRVDVLVVDAAGNKSSKISQPPGAPRDTASRFRGTGKPPSLTRLTFEVLPDDKVRHELDFADLDGDIVQVDFQWYRAGKQLFYCTLQSPKDIDLSGVLADTLTYEMWGFGGAAATFDRVDVVATDAAGNKSNTISQPPGAPRDTASRFRGTGKPPSLTRLTFEVLPDDKVRHELDFADLDGDIVQVDFQWYRAGKQLFYCTLQSPKDIDLSGVLADTLTYEMWGFGGAAATFDRVDVVATDAAGNKSNTISQPPGAPRDTASRFRGTGKPPSLTRLTFEVLPDDKVRHELDFADLDGDIVQVDFQWYRAGKQLFYCTLQSPKDIDLSGVLADTLTYEMWGFGGAAATFDRVDVVATDAAGNKSNTISQTPGAPRDTASRFRATGTPPSLTRLTFEVLSGDAVRHELDYTDPDGDIVLFDCEWYRAGKQLYYASIPVDTDLRDAKSGTYTLTITGFGDDATTFDRVDVVATDAAGNKSSTTSQTPGAPRDTASRFRAAGTPPSLTRLTFEVLSGDEVRHELDFADPDGNIVQIDYEWYRAGKQQFYYSLISSAETDLSSVKDTLALRFPGFGGAATTLDRVDVVATDSAGNKSNKMSQSPGPPSGAKTIINALRATFGRESRMSVRATVRAMRK